MTRQDSHGDGSGDWTVLESATEYETGWYTGGYDLVEQPDGSTKKYYWAALPPAVVVIALEAGSILFVEQYRPTIREHCLELPAGIVEDGEDFQTAGERELREETGFAAGETALLERAWVATGVLRHERGFVVATDLEGVAPDLDDNEFLSVERCSIDTAIARARSAPVTDATVEGLLLAAADGYLDL